MISLKIGLALISQTSKYRSLKNETVVTWGYPPPRIGIGLRSAGGTPALGSSKLKGVAWLPVAGFSNVEELGLLELAAGFAELLLVEVLVLLEVGLVAFGCSAAGAVIGTITSKEDNNKPKTDSAARSLLLSTLPVT